MLHQALAAGITACPQPPHQREHKTGRQLSPTHQLRQTPPPSASRVILFSNLFPNSVLHRCQPLPTCFAADPAATAGPTPLSAQRWDPTSPRRALHLDRIQTIRPAFIRASISARSAHSSLGFLSRNLSPSFELYPDSPAVRAARLIGRWPTPPSSPRVSIPQPSDHRRFDSFLPATSHSPADTGCPRQEVSN